MIGAFEGFVAALRREGVAASPAEWLDALRAIEVVGLEEPVRLREALRCTLVKRRGADAAFDRVFERWFAAPALAGRGRGAARAGTGAGAGRAGTPAEGAGPRAQAPRSDRSRPSSERRRRGGAADAGSSRDRDRFRDAVARLAVGVPAGRNRLRHVVVPPREDPARDARGPRGGAPGGGDPTRVDLRGPLDVATERELAAAVPRIVERLRLRPSRRARRRSRGRPAWRRVFRANAGTGGVPFVVPRRQPRRRRTRVVLAVDVSWSTARAAALFLAVAGALLDARRTLGATRVVAFVDRVVDATDAVRLWLGARSAAPRGGAGRGRPAPAAGIVRGGVSFAELVDGLAGLDTTAASDYGRAFHDLAFSPRRPRGRGTLFVVLGDGRTNRFDPQSWVFEDLAAGCGAVIWLVPEPIATWCDGDSALDVYLPACDVAVEVRDLAGLERGVAALARRL